MDNKPYYRDTNGDYWRSYRFITGASSFDQVETPQQFYESAVAFGSFQRLLADYPAETLHETIPGFPDGKERFAAFEKASHLFLTALRRVGAKVDVVIHTGYRTDMG